MATRLGISTKSLYDWKRRYGVEGKNARQAKDADELRALKAELKRVTEERDILKRPPRPTGISFASYFASQSR